MEWPKLKNIILTILVVTDLFLLSLVGLRSWNSARYLEQARANALQVLEQNAIKMDPGALPEDRSLPVAVFTWEREKEETLLEPLLGEVEESAQGSGRYQYDGKKGTAWLLSRGEFVVDLKQGAYPESGELEEQAVKALALMGIESMVLSSREETGREKVTLLQLWNAVPVYTCQIEVTGFDGGLQTISGTRLNGTPASAGELEMSAVTGLLRFLEKFEETGDVCTEILTMQAGYQLTTSVSGTSVLRPVWYFVTDTGAYALDLTANQLNKL